MGAYSILEGAIDLHVHANPDLYARPFDEIEIAQKARGAGYRGVLFKSHHTTNADRAYILNKLVDGVRVFGNITLNQTVGGINPQAVYAAAKLGVTEVKMPTVHAAHHIRIMGRPTSSSTKNSLPFCPSRRESPSWMRKESLSPQSMIFLELSRTTTLFSGRAT